MLNELPLAAFAAYACRGRFPNDELDDLRLSGALTLISTGRSSNSPIRRHAALSSSGLKRRAAEIDVGAARGWAVGLVLLAERRGIDAAAQQRRLRSPRCWRGISSMRCRPPIRTCS